MKEIIVTSQAELDALPADFDGRIIIKFGTIYNRAVVSRRFRYSVVARGNSSVEAWGNSSVEAWGNSSVEAAGNSQICDRTEDGNIQVTGNARIVRDPETIEEYCSYYGIEIADGKVRLYKAVHKRGGEYIPHQDSAFRYVIGETAAADWLDENPVKDCGHGIHMAHREWCVNYGRNWDDLAILEVETDAEKIIVPLDGVGKVRASEVLVIREVPLEECGLLGKMLAKRRAQNGT